LIPGWRMKLDDSMKKIKSNNTTSMRGVRLRLALI